jgi:hypothetical protein
MKISFVNQFGASVVISDTTILIEQHAELSGGIICSVCNLQAKELGWCSWCSDLLGAGWSGVRIPAGLRDFVLSITIQTGFGTHIISFNGYWVCYLEVMQPV